MFPPATPRGKPRKENMNTSILACPGRKDLTPPGLQVSMRVPLEIPSRPPTSQLSDMAPAADPTNHYLRDQIIENCGFLSVPHARIYLIVAKEPLGSFKAIVAKAEDGRRQALLSESGATIHEALQLLLLRSAESVQQHITANGFDFVLDKDDHDSDFECTARDRDGDDVSTDESLSDNETISIASTAKAGHRKPAAKPRGTKPAQVNKANIRRPRSRSRSPSSTRSRSRSVSSSGASSRSPSRGRHGPEPSRVRWRVHPHPQIRPPHMHATPWRGDPNLNLPRPPFVVRPPVFLPAAPPMVNTTAPAGVPPPPPPPPPTTTTTRTLSSTSSPTQRPPPPAPPMSTGPKPASPLPPPPPPPDPTNTPLRDVRLLICWRNYEQRVLVQAPLTKVGLQDAAIAYVRRSPSAFSGLAGDIGQGWSWPAGLRAMVQKVVVGVGQEKVEYDVRGYPGGDLRGLVDSCGVAGAVPQVEIGIVEGRVPGPVPGGLVPGRVPVPVPAGGYYIPEGGPLGGFRRA